MDNNVEEGLFISRMPENAQYKLKINQWEHCYDMTIIMKTIPEGVSCHICNSVMDDKMSDIDDCYYCEEDKIFMHKWCLIGKHRISKNPAISNFVNKTTAGFHEDKKVNVKFIKES